MLKRKGFAHSRDFSHELANPCVQPIAMLSSPFKRIITYSQVIAKLYNANRRR